MSIKALIKHIPLLTPALREPSLEVDTPLLCRRALIIALTALGAYTAAKYRIIDLPKPGKYIPRVAPLLIIMDCVLTKINSLCFHQTQKDSIAPIASVPPHNPIMAFHQMKTSVDEIKAFLVNPENAFIYTGIPSYMALLSSNSAENAIRALDQLHPLMCEQIHDLYVTVAVDGSHLLLERLLELPYTIFSNLQAPISIAEILRDHAHDLPPPNKKTLETKLQLELNHC
jgi:hypothetical protein